MPDLGSLSQVATRLQVEALQWGATLLWTLVLMVVGWLGAGWVERAIDAALGRLKHCDLMLRGFFSSLARWVILVFTGLAVLENIGVKTTSVIAVLGAAGLAVGLALQGTLTNLAAGIMLLLFRPFRVGDEIVSAAATGTVKAMALFHTELVTADNVQVILPNSALWGTALKNDSHYAIRRLVMLVPLPYPADAEAAMEKIRELVASDARVVDQPAPVVHLSRFISADKVSEIEVQVWSEATNHAKLQADLMAAFWRECIKPALG